MKTLLAIGLLISSVAAGQELSAKLKPAEQELSIVGGKLFVKQSLSGTGNFTLQIPTGNSLGLNNVVFNTDERYLFNRPDLFIINMQPPGMNEYRYNFYNDHDYLGALASGISAIFNGAFSKNYQVKPKDPLRRYNIE